MFNFGLGGVFGSPRKTDDFGGVIVWENEQETATDSVYSDRLFQWGSDKYNESCEKVWNNRGQYFDRREPQDIERFLSLYFNKKITLTKITEYENKSSGYPCWRFDYRKAED